MDSVGLEWMGRSDIDFSAPNCAKWNESVLRSACQNLALGEKEKWTIENALTSLTIYIPFLDNVLYIFLELWEIHNFMIRKIQIRRDGKKNNVLDFCSKLLSWPLSHSKQKRCWVQIINFPINLWNRIRSKRKRACECIDYFLSPRPSRSNQTLVFISIGRGVNRRKTDKSKKCLKH